jgi:formylglycine-generating enzyme required for sulfatase activity
LLWLLTACHGTKIVETTDPRTLDLDGDGYPASMDCNDQDPAIHPAAHERCDGVDENCNDLVDEDAVDAPVGYPDDDGDGYGDPDRARSMCEDLEGYVTNGLDTDDGDALDYPGSVTVHAGFRMVRVPRGTFLMGSPRTERGRDENEIQHEVTLTRSFLLGETEVTQAEYRELTGLSPSFFSGCGDCPVERISWYDAAYFTNQLSASEGLASCYQCEVKAELLTCEPLGSPYLCEGYRLPTEAEWEYAARANEAAAFSNGGDLMTGKEAFCEEHLFLDNGQELDDLAWFCGNAGRTTHPVGELDPNDWNLLDMSGNVQEWVHDAFRTYTADPTEDPFNSSGSVRDARGGSWHDTPQRTRSAYRTWYASMNRMNNVGFRVCRN